MKHKSKLFGTDGIRGVANEYPMTVEMAVSVGKAVASFFNTDGRDHSVIIGKDTRISGDMLVAALGAGVCAMGSNAVLVGCVPTPAVAYLTRSSKAVAGSLYPHRIIPTTITESRCSGPMAINFRTRRRRNWK